MKKEDLDLIVEISIRAEEMGLLVFDRISLILDLEYTTEEFNLRLMELLNADDYDFAHDICGIMSNLNRQTMKMDNFFVPRYSSNK